MKAKRYYSLFERSVDGKHWIRLTDLYFTREDAIRVFQRQLLDSALFGGAELQIRAVTVR